ncbi:hypothetical protein F751_5201 [Auxenochlorella protothecoides]|uniref:RecF/RecN/SMC N-terminal domain-containing protein n=1 Tax=Auxenochlorella protothecoides TaxID=3075 RepID=A0A087SQT6_AUXPR|nr:hypothetical protein F751_5201 [Auxenochlorella protothecoides]KFM28090.1 hypothetical protein F751_5201 [Auxenochlorella protothecoides]
MAAIEALQQQGVEVEILAPAPSAAPVRIQDSEDLTPPQLFAAYAKSTGMPAGVEARGLSLLQALLTSQGSSAAATVLTFGQVTLSGFLSFADRVSYPLDARGVVVLTGSVDGQGFQSNGAGKSALAMSSLWCLTGGMDARSEGASTGRGLSVTDIIHSACKSATVRVEGTVNGLPFVVERTARRRGGKLSLMVDGVDRTMQEMRMTQAGDRAFKEELGKLVDLSIWEEARAVANKELADRKAALAAVCTELPVRQGFRDRFQEDLIQSEAEETLLAAEQARLAARAAAQASASADAELAARQTARDRARSQAQLEAQQARHAIDTRLARLERELQEHEGMGERLQSAGVEAGSLLDRLRATLGQSMNDGAVDVDALSLQSPPEEPHRDTHAFDSQRLLEQLGRSASQAAACIAAEPVPPGSASAANPHEVEAGRLRAQLATEAARVLELEGRGADLAAQLADLKLVHDALRPTGVVNYLLEGVLADLQATTGTFLAALAPSLTLELKPSRPGRADPEAVVEQVEKSVKVRVPGSQVLQPRSIKQLSGGERRRLALSLALGFSALAKRRGLLQSNLLVLDEVMQHLDAEGCARVAALLRTLPQASVLVVAQRGSAAAEAAEQLDLVVKEQGRSRVLLDHRGEA